MWLQEGRERYTHALAVHNMMALVHMSALEPSSLARQMPMGERAMEGNSHARAFVVGTTSVRRPQLDAGCLPLPIL